MYKALTRLMVRRSIAELNAGDADASLRFAHPDIALAFPGDNSWATMHRPVVKGRRVHVTHRGIHEVRAFSRRLVDEGPQFRIEDILVNGPPWNTRVALRAHDFIPGPDGTDAYNNRIVSMITLRWGRITAWETYADTERVARLDADARRTVTPPSG
jgi:ketosteroid isomerase-like protein